VGPYTGKLDNRTARVSLEKPQAPETAGDAISWVIVDEMIYADQAPWDAAADGTGQALQRKDFLGNGLDPANWSAKEPTPGWAEAVLVGTPPTITQPPQSRTVVEFGSAQFTVQAEGTAPLSYQWQVNGVDSALATNATFVLERAYLTNSGDRYSVTVSNAWGTASAMAVLTVTPDLTPPRIISSPTNLMVVAGTPAVFQVTVESSEQALFYQWMRDGTNLTDATQSILTIPHAAAADAGLYSVAVSNAAGARVVSESARLTVLPASCQIELSESGMQVDGTFQLSILALAGHRYAIRISSNLIDWQSVITNAPPDGRIVYQDVDAKQATQRFYRVDEAP
jgi:hypothetical protein